MSTLTFAHKKATALRSSIPSAIDVGVGRPAVDAETAIGGTEPKDAAAGGIEPSTIPTTAAATAMDRHRARVRFPIDRP